ncbi:MAG TPA: TolC family protein [Vicinamibacterales bacterium]|nr:TolC family protein [Vicinamibacterales bacterium]
MRFDKRFCARIAVTAGLAAASVSVFGLTPVHAQTTPAAPAATQQGQVRRLSIDDAVATALEQNLDLQVQRINPELQALTISQFRAAYTPNFVSQISTSDNTQPSTSILEGGAANTGITSGNSVFNFGVASLTNWYGGSYDVRFNNTRTTTTNLLQSFSPQLNNVLSASYSQPLLRNFKIDGARQQLLVSQKNKEITDTQLKQSITQTTRNVRNAYYDLIYAIGNLAVQRQSLQLSQQSLRDNRARVEIGTMAPLDIVQAEAEVARGEEAVIIAEAAIERQQDTLRTLIYNPASPDFWTARIEPTDTMTFVPTKVDVDAAVKTALTERTDLQNARKNIEINDVNIRYFRNQSLPDVTASLNYNARAIGGLQVRRAPDPNNSGLPTGEIISSSERTYLETLRTTLSGDFPGWNVQFNVAYPIGQSSQEAQLARARLQHTQSERQIASLELAITTQVRDAGRNVQTNARRVQATRSSREFAERRLEAEEKRYQAGLTQNFFVLQAQRDLSVARNNELLALVQYAQSVVNFQAVQQAPLAGGGFAIQQQQ